LAIYKANTVPRVKEPEINMMELGIMGFIAEAEGG